MTEVDFYVLAEAGEAGLLRVACRVAEKAWGQGLGVYVLASDDEQAARMDDALWTCRQEGFVPHERWTGQGTPGARVLIGACAAPPSPPDVLVNLGAPVPPWYRECARVAEIVGGDDEVKASGRARYREYRDAGIGLRTHEV